MCAGWPCGMVRLQNTKHMHCKLSIECVLLIFIRKAPSFLFSCCFLQFSGLSIFPSSPAVHSTRMQVDSIYKKWLNVTNEKKRNQNPAERMVRAQKKWGSWEHRKITIACRSFIPCSQFLATVFGSSNATVNGDWESQPMQPYTQRNFISNIIQWLACCCSAKTEHRDLVSTLFIICKCWITVDLSVVCAVVAVYLRVFRLVIWQFMLQCAGFFLPFSLASSWRGFWTSTSTSLGSVIMQNTQYFARKANAPIEGSIPLPLK